MIHAVEWKEDGEQGVRGLRGVRPLRPLRPLRGIRLLDQTRLPLEVVYIDCADIETLAEAISSLRVRGAPAIGIAAAYGMALATLQSSATCFEALYKEVEAVGRLLAATRPTAVNLFWAISRMERVLLSCAQGLSPPQGSQFALAPLASRRQGSDALRGPCHPGGGYRRQSEDWCLWRGVD